MTPDRANLITLCPGWIERHAQPVILAVSPSPDGRRHVSHGMCPACAQAWQAAVDTRNPAPIDPRRI